MAFVVVRQGHTLAADDIHEWVDGRVGKTQWLAAVEIVPTLPRSAIGKVLKRELRAKYLRPGRDDLAGRQD